MSLRHGLIFLVIALLAASAAAYPSEPRHKPLKILVFADMEGISGLPSRDFTFPTGKYYDKGCLHYTWDINACVNACFKAGANTVFVRDGHSSGRNAVVAQVDPRAVLIQGPTKERLPHIRECDAVIFLGYHAMAHTPNAFAAHTYSSKTVDNMWMNDRLTGEIGIDSAVAGEYGRPVIMVSGDDKACREAEEWIPGVVTCQVKEGLALESASLIPSREAWKLIEQKTIEAIGRIGSIKPAQVSHPVTIRKQMLSPLNMNQWKDKPGVRIVDNRTTEKTANTVEEAFGF
jgi:D-amino peptidase